MQGATKGAASAEGAQEVRSGQLCIELRVQPRHGLMMLTLWTCRLPQA